MDLARNYLLIDLENVQPENLALLEDPSFHVYVFVGANQSKVKIELARALQMFGERGYYIQISGVSRNNLDFHIAYYAGELSAADPDATFYIISKDKGFDRLVEHLRTVRERKVKIWRHGDIREVPQPGAPNGGLPADRIDTIIKNLTGRGLSRPRKVKTLSNSIKTLFPPPLCDAELDELVKELERRQIITVDNSKVTYNLP